MTCRCSGTGFVIVVGDYRSNQTDSRHKKVSFAKRCPDYERYFRELGGNVSMRFLEDVPVAEMAGECEAAIHAHRTLKNRALRREQEQEGRYGRR